MKVMLFAAGLGTRLRPLTDTMPKAMVPVDGRPLIDICLHHLIEQGASEVVVNVHHFAQQIIDYINAHEWRIPVRISDESEELLNTGGGLRKAGELFSDDGQPILIHNVDILSNAPIQEFYKNHLTHDATLLVSEAIRNATYSLTTTCAYADGQILLRARYVVLLPTLNPKNCIAMLSRAFTCFRHDSLLSWNTILRLSPSWTSI